MLIFLHSDIVSNMSSSETPRIDKSAFSIASLHDESDEKVYWLSKSPYERLQAVEQMRRIIYGYDPAVARMQKVLEIVQRGDFGAE